MPAHIDTPDKIFPHFLATKIPPGLAGLFMSTSGQKTWDCKMELRYLRELIAVAEDLSFSHAAEQLHVVFQRPLTRETRVQFRPDLFHQGMREITCPRFSLVTASKVSGLPP